MQWCATALIPAFALIAMAGCSHGPADTFGEREAVPILAAKVEQKTVSDTIRAIGRVEAFSTVDVKAQISGQIMQVNFRQGQDVKQGDLLFTIDTAPVRSRAESGAGESRQGSRAVPAGRRRRASLLDSAQGESRIAPAIRSGRGYSRRAVSVDASGRSRGADCEAESRVLRDSRADRRAHRRPARACRQPGQARRRHRDGRYQPGASGVRRLRDSRAEAGRGARVHGGAQACCPGLTARAARSARVGRAELRR